MKQIQFVLLCAAVCVLTGCDIIKQQLSAAYLRNLPQAPFDVVIVPGTPYDSARISPIYKARMFWAKALFDKGIARNLIFSGAAVHSAYIEAQTMKTMADSMGIPGGHTYIESRAQHSLENVAYSIELARQLGFKKIAVATDPFQAYYFKRHLNVKVLPIALLPFSLDSMPLYYKRNAPLIDARQAKIENFIPLERREVAAR